MLARALRLWRTVRWLKPIQVFARLWHLIYVPNVSNSELPQCLEIATSDVRGKWVLPARRRVSMSAETEFCFLNETRALAACGWDDAAVSKLWRYNLHYFDDLNAFDAVERVDWHHALIKRWIAENPPFVGSGWEPYPTSLRIVNWVKWALAAHGGLPGGFDDSLALQARWLRKRLEHHLQGNHLFVNAKALVFAGLWFSHSEEGQEWIRTGERLLDKQIPEQFLEDGGQFERSPMYHALGLEDLLDLLNVCRAFGYWESTLATKQLGEAALKDRIRRAFRFLNLMSFDDGCLGHFNDSAAGVAPDNAELIRYGRELKVLAEDADHGQGKASLLSAPNSGYVRVSKGGIDAILDVAPIGPDYLPGHAHADTLSFEAYFCGHPLIVNSGTSEYGLGAERLRQRGTPAHSTVSVNGLDSSEVWSGFRVARRARPVDLRTREDAQEVVIECAHDGYMRLPGKPIHQRRWRFSSGGLEVSDRVDGGFDEAIAYYHLHPNVIVEMSSEGLYRLECGGSALELHVKTGSAQLQASSYHPEFGLVLANKKIAVQLVDGRAQVQFVSA